ncbi:MAG: helix-turn-helix domain-containing protein [Asticcacaulis sp.]
MTAKPKRVRRRAGIRTHRSYTVDEVARALSVKPITVRRWIKAGLPALTERRPALIQGADLIKYLDESRAPKHTCAPHECFCVKCRLPRTPAGGMADYLPFNATTGNLRGLCPECPTLIHKRVRKAALAALAPILTITVVQAKTPIRDSQHTSVNDHFAKDSHNHA